MHLSCAGRTESFSKVAAAARCATLIALALLMSATGGCKSQEEKELDAALAHPTPLPHDPTHEFELAQWWMNETHLLRLDDNAYYELYKGHNRYSDPIEHGRWGQISYAVMRLSPYDSARPVHRRVEITRLDGELALLLPKLKPMTAITAPPAVTEDQLIGTWSGPMGTLRLEPSLRYSLVATPMAAENAAPVLVAGHDGRWRIHRDHLILQPQTPGMQPLRLPMQLSDDSPRIEGPGGALTPVVPADLVSVEQ